MSQAPHSVQPQYTFASYSHRPKLTTAGTKLLKAFFENVTHYPDDKQKHELVAQVRELGGNDHYSFDKVDLWFSLRRSGHAPAPQTKKTAPAPAQTLMIEPRRTRKRVTAEGKTILDEYFKKCQYPTAAQKRELAAQILAIPGNDHYSAETVSSWFHSKRKQHAKLEPSEDLLAIFLKETPRPTDTLLEAWAKALKWHSVKALRQEIERRQVERMPTPSSPYLAAMEHGGEDDDDEVDELDHDEELVIQHTTPQFQAHPHEQSYASFSALPQTSSVSAPEPDDIKSLLSDIAHDMDRAEVAPKPHSLTREEFNRLFGPVAVKMRAIVDEWDTSNGKS